MTTTYGEYGKCENKLGYGGFSDVYKTDKGYAVKKYTEDVEYYGHYAVRELIFLKHFDHPNIVKLIGYKLDKKGYYLVLECGLMTLEDVAAEKFQLPDFRKSILKQLLIATEYLHSVNVWHHDIKPSNILVFENDAVKLIDFTHSYYAFKEGLKKKEDIGTYPYCPPEYWNREGADDKYDIWTIGMSMMKVCGWYDTKEKAGSSKVWKELSLSLPKKVKSIMSDRGVGEVESDLYVKMVCEASERIGASSALRHAYFGDEVKEEGVKEDTEGATKVKEEGTKEEIEKAWEKHNLSLSMRTMLFMWLYDVVRRQEKDLSIAMHSLFRALTLFHTFLEKLEPKAKSEEGIQFVSRETLQLYGIMMLRLVLNINGRDDLDYRECHILCDYAYVDKMDGEVAQRKILEVLELEVLVPTVLDSLEDRHLYKHVSAHALFKLYLEEQFKESVEKMIECASTYPNCDEGVKRLIEMDAINKEEITPHFKSQFKKYGGEIKERKEDEKDEGATKEDTTKKDTTKKDTTKEDTTKEDTTKKDTTKEDDLKKEDTTKKDTTKKEDTKCLKIKSVEDVNFEWKKSNFITTVRNYLENNYREKNKERRANNIITIYKYFMKEYDITSNIGEKFYKATIERADELLKEIDLEEIDCKIKKECRKTLNEFLVWTQEEGEIEIKNITIEVS